MNILGINCFSHDTAACLLQDGEPAAFVEEERLNRDKHTKAFPDLAIRFCLERGGVGIEDIVRLYRVRLLPPVPPTRQPYCTVVCDDAMLLDNLH